MSKVYLEQRDAHHVPGASSEAEVTAAVRRSAKALAECDALLITAGAGMGVDSGMPDFRGSTGLWKDRSVALSYEDMSDDKWFSEDPLFAWGVNYTQIAMYRKARPHPGYDVLLQWAKRLGKPCMVFTSNIDSHFQFAGFPDDEVVTCHGDMHHLQCTDRTCHSASVGGDRGVWSAECIPDGLDDQVDPGKLRFLDESALEAEHFRCPRCKKLARPNVWFCHDRNYVPRNSAIARRDTFNKWLDSLKEGRKNLVVIECGGGMAIPSVRVEGEDAVEGTGPHSLLVRLNPTDCKVPAGHGVGIPLGAREGLARIDAALREAMKSARSASRPAAERRAAAGRGSQRGALGRKLPESGKAARNAGRAIVGAAS